MTEYSTHGEKALTDQPNLSARPNRGWSPRIKDDGALLPKGSASVLANLGITVITLPSSGEVPNDRIRELSGDSTVIVSGPPGGSGWRAAALAAGAFGCFSEETPLEDRACLMMAAVRYRSAQQDAAAVRRHSERLCFELLQSYGSAREELAESKEEASRIQRSLCEIQQRILQALL
jgi:hypothetical protein